MVYFVCALKSTVFPLFFIMSYCFLVRIFATIIGLTQLAAYMRITL